MTTGQQIAQLRKERNMSQEDLADAMQVSRQAVSKWETGLSKPDTENLIRLAELFVVDVNALIGNDIAPEKTPSSKRTIVILSIFLALAVCAACVFAGLWLAEWKADQFAGEHIYQNVLFVDRSNLMEEKPIYLTDKEQQELAAFIQSFHFTDAEVNDDIFYGGRSYHVSFTKDTTRYEYAFTANGFYAAIYLGDGNVARHEFEVDHAMFYYLDALKH